MRGRKMMANEKYIMVILPFFCVVGVCKRSLGDDHMATLCGYQLISAGEATKASYWFSLTIVIFIVLWSYFWFNPLCTFHILMLYRFFYKPFLWDYLVKLQYLLYSSFSLVFS